MNELVALAWPMSRLGEAVETLARHAGLRPAPAVAAAPPQFRGELEQEELDRWLDWACARLGIEVESVEAAGSEFSALLRGAGPALVRFLHAGQQYVLLLLKASARGAVGRPGFARPKVSARRRARRAHA
jgi:hypothetical protein